MEGDFLNDAMSALAEALNKRKWFPFIRKGKVLDLFHSQCRKWQDETDAERLKERKDLTDRCRSYKQELDKEREDCYAVVRSLIGEHKRMMVECSKVAYCLGECGAAKMSKCDGSCQRKNRYVQSLKDGVNELTSEDFESMLTKEQVKIWKIINKEK